MSVEIIKEGALNDDTLYLADDGTVFKGGYVAIVEYYTYANAWGNHKHIKRFRSLQSMQKFTSKLSEG